MSSMKLERWLRTTPPIFVVRDGYLSCEDVVGFASVGSGSRHAESQMMLARHAWNADLDPTLLTTYLAKKRAEVAPGVGTETDMFMITGPGNNLRFRQRSWPLVLWRAPSWVWTRLERGTKGSLEAERIERQGR